MTEFPDDGQNANNEVTMNRKRNAELSGECGVGLLACNLLDCFDSSCCPYTQSDLLGFGKLNDFWELCNAQILSLPSMNL